MIIYGWRASHVKSQISDTVKCVQCQTEKTTLFSVFSRYVHIFWIPLFPYGRKGFTECQKCGYETDSSYTDDHYKRGHRELLQQTNIPFWQFAGLLIIVAFVSWGVISSQLEKENTRTYLESPSVGDKYFYKTDEGNYSVFKIRHIGSDSVEVQQNDYESSRKNRVDEIDIQENYGDYQFRLAKTDLKSMYESGLIYSIKRN